MKAYNILLLVLSFFAVTTVSAQINPDDLTAKINKQTKKIEIVKKSDGSNVTASFKLNKANIDIFDKGGDYAGTVELKDWNVPVDEFSPDEIVKISVISLTIIENGKVIELKDIRLQL